MDDSDFETLASLLEREGPLSVERALTLLREAAKSLADAHAAGILHCDLQPATMLVTRDGHVLLAESTLARRQGEARPPDAPGTERYISPLYYPPEAAHARPLDTRTDLFLLGATFYHAMLGRPPFNGSDPETRALNYLRREAPPLNEQLPGTPVLVNVLMQKLLRRDPDERYQTAQELYSAVERTERMLQKRQPARRPSAGSGRTEIIEDRAAPAAAVETASLAEPAAAQAAEAEPVKRPRTRRLAPSEHAAEREAAAPREERAAAAPATRPITARAKALEKPLWQDKRFIYGAAAGGFLLLVILVLAFSGGSRRPAMAQRKPATSIVPVVTPTKETRVELPKPKPKPKPKTETPVEPPPPPKPKDTVEPPPKKRWGPVKGTAAGTETYEEFLARTKGLEVNSAGDYIIQWEFAGPYPAPGNTEKIGPYDMEFPPEKPGESPTWTPLQNRIVPDKPWLLEFSKSPQINQIAKEHAAIYIRTRVHSPKTQEVQAWLGSDDSVKFWLNGKLIHANRKDRACKPDEDRFGVTLKEGWNDLMAKISQGQGEWGFCLRFRTTDGDALKGLKADPAGR